MKILLYLSTTLYFLLPFQFALSPFADFDIAIVRLFIVGIIFFYLAYSLYKKKLFIPKGWIITLLTAFVMWILFSLFFTPVPTWTVRKIIFIVSIAPLAFILSTLFIYKPSTKKYLLRATVLGAMCISIVGIVQFILQFIISLNSLLIIWTKLTPFFLGGAFSKSVIMHNSWLVNVAGTDLMRAVAFFPDPHIFAFYLGLIIPMSIALFFTTKNYFWLISFAVLLTADLLTFSRGGYIGLCVGLASFVFLLWPNISAKIQHLIIGLLLIFAFVLFIPNNPITNRLASSFDHTDGSNTERIELWREATEQILQRPFIGTGLGAYSYVINPQTNYRTPFYVHNLALDITVELGIIGLVLFFGIFIALLIILFKNRIDFIALCSVTSVIIFLTHSLFDTPIFSVHIFPLLMLLISIGISYENPKYTI
jgi:O-antigen ligase